MEIDNIVNMYNSDFKISKVDTKTLDVSKIESLEDVKKILEFLDIQYTEFNGVTNSRAESFEKVKHLFK